MKRIAADGYLEPVPGASNSERLQSRHPSARMVRINLPLMAYFVDPMLVGTPPTIFIAVTMRPRAQRWPGWSSTWGSTPGTPARCASPGCSMR